MKKILRRAERGERCVACFAGSIALPIALFALSENFTPQPQRSIAKCCKELQILNLSGKNLLFNEIDLRIQQGISKSQQAALQALT
jgi:hypothetical protein